MPAALAALPSFSLVPPPVEWLALIGAAGNAVAHLCFKRAMGAGAPRVLLAARWGTGAVAMTGALLVGNGWGAFHPSWSLLLLALGSISGPVVGWLLYLRALPHLDVSVAQPIFNSSVVVSMVLAVLLLGERPNAFTWLGALLILVGVQLLQRSGSRHRRHGSPTVAGGAVAPGPKVAPWAVGWLTRWINPYLLPALASAGCLGIASFCFKVGLGELSPVETNWVRTTVPSLVLCGLILAGELPPRAGSGGLRPLLTWQGLALAVAAGIANDVVGWGARLVALKHGPLTVVEPLASTSPLFAALLGAWILGERLDPWGWAGIVATLLGGALLGGLGR